MMLASCKNCCHFAAANSCELGLAPDSGEHYCKKYAMTVGFREEILRLARADLQRDINRAVLQVKVRQAEATSGFAG